jgi:tRNA nucleotidyltransferase/poly(A) polymerase
VIHRLIGMWALRRALRLLTADDPRPLRERLTREGKRILVGAAITLALLVLGAIGILVLLVALLT